MLFKGKPLFKKKFSKFRIFAAITIFLFVLVCIPVYFLTLHKTVHQHLDLVLKSEAEAERLFSEIAAIKQEEVNLSPFHGEDRAVPSDERSIQEDLKVLVENLKEIPDRGVYSYGLGFRYFFHLENQFAHGASDPESEILRLLAYGLFVQKFPDFAKDTAKFYVPIRREVFSPLLICQEKLAIQIYDVASRIIIGDKRETPCLTPLASEENPLISTESYMISFFRNPVKVKKERQKYYFANH